MIGHYICHETPQAAIREIHLAFWKYLNGQYIAYLKLKAFSYHTKSRSAYFG